MKFKFQIILVVITSLLMALTSSCEKEVTKVVPKLTTTAVSNITSTSASGGGSITSDGGASVVTRGVCWSLSQNPTTSDSKTSDGIGIGTFTSNVTGLSPGTKYYVRAYATNSIGTGYGNEISVTSFGEGIFFNPNLTYGSVTDIDGNVYKTILIGSQTWMAENLKTTKYRNGSLIGTTTPATLDISAESTPKYQWAYDGNESNVAAYGRLYTWYAATDSRGICPAGWHLPSQTDWNTLSAFLGAVTVAGGQLKEIGTTHWQSPNTGASNNSGFTALPSGFHDYKGTFTQIGMSTGWWIPTEDNTTAFWARGVIFNDSSLNYWIIESKSSGFSVRCLKL